MWADRFLSAQARRLQLGLLIQVLTGSFFAWEPPECKVSVHQAARHPSRARMLLRAHREAGAVAALTEDQVEKAALPTAMADWLALPLNVSAVFVMLGWQIPLFNHPNLQKVSVQQSETGPQ